MEQRGLGLTRDGPEKAWIAQGWNREGLDRPGMDQRRLGLTRDGIERAWIGQGWTTEGLDCRQEVNQKRIRLNKV
jgi:hypothetical protein